MCTRERGMGMKKRAELTPEQLEWLKDAYRRKVPPRNMARHLNLHVDTVKRLLDRYGIHKALSAKHITPEENKDEWQRPCMKCKCKKPRPRLQYICDPCKRDPKEPRSVNEDFIYC